MTDQKNGQWKGFVWGGASVAIAAGAIALGLYAYWHVAWPTDTSAGDTKSEPPSTIQHMQLKAQFAGPLKDTVIQRWQDPGNGASCYIYLPVVVQHSAPTPTGFVQYGGNGTGSISCLPRP